MTVIDLFRVPWADLDLRHVRAFLDNAGDEGVTWEAKADDARGGLHTDSLAKAGCGLSNRVGGYVLIGAKQETKGGPWSLPGITPPNDEATLWIGKALRNLSPSPNHEAKTWTLDDGRLVAVVWVDPVDEPPCMTRRGQVYERVSGETLPVTDPARLDTLYRRGRHARTTADQRAQVAGERALDNVDWYSERAVGIAVALSAVGRDTDDLNSLVFVPSFRSALVAALDEFVGTGHPERRRVGPDTNDRTTEQDAFTVIAHFEERYVLLGGGNAYPRPRSTWLLQATWDGAVAAAAAFDPEAAQTADAGEVIAAGWRAIADLVPRLGGYGPAQLTAGVFAAAERPREMPHEWRGRQVPPPPAPPRGTLYAQLPETTWMGRWVGMGEPDPDILASLQRELERAAGRESLEPESD